MSETTYAIYFDAESRSEDVRLWLGTECAEMQTAFAQDPVWQYEWTTLLVRSEPQVRIRLTGNLDEICFQSMMTSEEFEANYAEIVRVCGVLSDTMLIFTRAHCQL